MQTAGNSIAAIKPAAFHAYKSTVEPPLCLYICEMKLLMVCLGNICRSPLAEGIMQAKVREAGLDWEVDSAGTNGFHVGEAPHQLSQKVARLHGIDISEQRARRFTKADMEQYDKIYAMANEVLDEMKQRVPQPWPPGKVELLMEAVFPGEARDVPDPWYGPEPGYHEVYAMIDAACDAILEKYTTQQIQQ
jgi:protein-tyrosine phosphatase